MINEKEISATQLSATKKDFYQIWNELLDTAKKLSERWDPTSTNESDPGIVLLKVLTAIADKLNYTIDKNTLEAFMPSAAQEESMKKLCDMLGYDMKYYQSATTKVKISFTKKDDKGDLILNPTDIVFIPKFTNIKNNDEDINYFTTEPVLLDGKIPSQEVEVMEGTIVSCGDDTDNIISIAQIDDNYRYYLPESMIAENGIFVTNISDSNESEPWTRVLNLNTQPIKAHCFKFGFDSKSSIPYIQFPDDIAAIIEDGLIIKYTRTNGANGNISINTLSKLKAPELWSTIKDQSNDKNHIEQILDEDNFTIKNDSAAINGRNKESINDAYINYKHTIGTFDTLITCRDYINKIYQMTNGDTNQTPVVSNIVVSDIRDDINHAVNICTFTDYGIAYIDKSIMHIEHTEDDEEIKVNDIEHFDLILYPFNEISSFSSETAYNKSFEYSISNMDIIKANLEKNKTISHNIIYPATTSSTDIVCIKNYLKLKAKITTNTKVNTNEEKLILNAIYNAIYENFNARKVDFGEEIPFDTILNVIQNADTRIKNVALEEPVLYTKLLMADGNEYDCANPVVASSSTPNPGLNYYNKLVLRNVLAGRIELFDYDKRFTSDYTDAVYPGKKYNPIYEQTTNPNAYIHHIDSNLKIAASQDNDLSSANIKLTDNEVIQFRAPNFKTTKTYPAYINYFLHLTSDDESSSSTTQNAIPATFDTLLNYLDGTTSFDQDKWNSFLTDDNVKKFISEEESPSKAKLVALRTKYTYVFTKTTDTTDTYSKYTDDAAYSGTIYYFDFKDESYAAVYAWICKQDAKYVESGDTKAKLKGIYRNLGSDMTRPIGKMVDSYHRKFTIATKLSSSNYNNYFIQVTHAEDGPTYTKDGFGQDADYTGIKAYKDYKLKNTEYLLINYVPATTDDETKADPVNLVYKGGENGVIIRPNFDMLSSKDFKAAGHTPSKKDGYSFDDYNTYIADVGGLFTFNSNEQLEVREPAEVTLNDGIYNLYWERNDEADHTENNIVEFTFDEESGKAYTLKAGEYIYYTDNGKTDLAYFGNGTKIYRSDQAIRLTKDKTTDTAKVDDIANNGLLADIPWKRYQFNPDKYLTFTEYQYRTITKGDTLVNLPGIDEINSLKWKAIEDSSKVKYRLFGDESDTSLTDISVDGATWEVKSILNIDVSSTKIQTLKTEVYGNNITKEDSITIHYYDATGQEYYPYDERPVVLASQKDSAGYHDLSIKTNYAVQTSNSTILTVIPKYDTYGAVENYNYDFNIKVFKKDDVKLKLKDGTEETINFGNYGTTGQWTRLATKEVHPRSAGPFATLNTIIPDSDHGLLMIYYARGSGGANITTNAYLKVTGMSDASINIFNSTHGSSTGLFDDTWWKGGKDDTESENGTNYYLRTGVNVIELDNKVSKLEIYAENDTQNSKQDGILVFSHLNLCKYESNTPKVNKRLDYKAINEAVSSDEQLFRDIVAYDPDYIFYYNAVIDNSLAIDLNTNIETEKLSSATAWYDYNNINNKFVISEIDTTEMKKGIVLTNSSRR